MTGTVGPHAHLRTTQCELPVSLVCKSTDRKKAGARGDNLILKLQFSLSMLDGKKKKMVLVSRSLDIYRLKKNIRIGRLRGKNKKSLTNVLKEI